MADQTPTPTSKAPRVVAAPAFLVLPEDMRRERRQAEGSAAVPELSDHEPVAGDGVPAGAAVMNRCQLPDAEAIRAWLG